MFRTGQPELPNRGTGRDFNGNAISFMRLREITCQAKSAISARAWSISAVSDSIPACSSTMSAG